MSNSLLPAITMSERLNEQFKRLALTPYLKWWQCSFNTLEITVKDSDWDSTQLVYTDGTEVHSYFNLSWKRPENFIDNISCINFKPDNRALFATAIYKVLKWVTEEQNTPKIEWRVTVGNPIEEAYDRFCVSHGGRIVGTLKNHVLINNRYYDTKLYEWINHKYICNKCGYVIKNVGENNIVASHCNKCHGEMIYKNPFNFGE